MIKFPVFQEKKEFYKWLVANKSTIEALKKQTVKEGTDVPFAQVFYDLKDNQVNKDNSPVPDLESLDVLKVRPVINTTNFLDTHLDVHLNGLWDKSLRENKSLFHLQEHQRVFAAVISDGKDLRAYTEKMTWKSLGFDYAGSTEAFIFDSNVRKARNPFMFGQYGKGYVKNHSVGMQYVQMTMAINDKDYGAEYEAWEKYYPLIVNKDFADEMGVFWAIKEGKAIEGSAVLLGSNRTTPTLENNMKSSEPSNHSETEPLKDTQVIDFSYLVSKLNLKN